MAVPALRPGVAAVALLALAGSAPATAQPHDAAAEFIRRSFGDASYLRADADLNGDGRAEIFAYVTDPRLCGSGGCNLLVLSPEDGHLRVVLRSTVAQRPIVLLPTATLGWRDIGVTVAGGGITRAYVARMRYDWNRDRYPANPTLEPRAVGDGEVLIGAAR